MDEAAPGAVGAGPCSRKSPADLYAADKKVQISERTRQQVKQGRQFRVKSSQECRQLQIIKLQQRRADSILGLGKVRGEGGCNGTYGVMETSPLSCTWGASGCAAAPRGRAQTV